MSADDHIGAVSLKMEPWPTGRPERRPRTWRRVVHDAFHLALLPLGVLAVAGAFSERAHEVIEKIDLAVHGVIVVFAIDSLRDFYRAHRRKVFHAP